MVTTSTLQKRKLWLGGGSHVSRVTQNRTVLSCRSPSLSTDLNSWLPILLWPKLSVCLWFVVRPSYAPSIDPLQVAPVKLKKRGEREREREREIHTEREKTQCAISQMTCLLSTPRRATYVYLGPYKKCQCCKFFFPGGRQFLTDKSHSWSENNTWRT